jgi:hypothetical protein
MQVVFKITISLLDNFLVTQIKCPRDVSIFLGPEAYMNKTLKKLSISEAKGVSRPASREEIDNLKHIGGKVPYREVVGIHVYIVAATRPDIAFAVHKAARGMERPVDKDWSRVNHIFHYL